MKTIYVLVAREIEEGSEALVAFEDINEAIRVLYTLQAYHEPFYEKWAHQLARSLDPAYAIARAAHPARVYSNCPSLIDIAEFDIQEVYFHPANPQETKA